MSNLRKEQEPLLADAKKNCVEQIVQTNHRIKCAAKSLWWRLWEAKIQQQGPQTMQSK